MTYFISTDKRTERYKNMVESYSKRLDIPVWAVQFSRARSTPCDKMILGASISDFINLINNAALVLTDSFHGVAISLNLNANFVAINNQGNPERVRHLLNEVGLTNRIEMKTDEYSEIMYDSVNKKLNSLRTDSQEWILNVLNNKE